MRKKAKKKAFKKAPMRRKRNPSPFQVDGHWRYKRINDAIKKFKQVRRNCGTDISYRGHPFISTCKWYDNQEIWNKVAPRMYFYGVTEESPEDARLRRVVSAPRRKVAKKKKAKKKRLNMAADWDDGGWKQWFKEG